MVIECPKCGTKSTLDESDFAGRSSLELKCAKCQHRFALGFPTRLAPAYGAAAQPASAIAPAQPPFEAVAGELPAGKTVAISFVAGPMQGPLIRVDKAEITIGRSGTDVLIADPEVSRRHCMLVIGSKGATLTDLGSTNGTFIGDQKITAAELSPGAQFRVGASVLSYTLESKENG